MQDYLENRIHQLLGEPGRRRFSAIYESVFLATSVGKVRKANQDRAITVSAQYASEPERNFLLAAVCDGMGGMERGDEAASIALSAFVAKLLRDNRRSPRERLIDAAHHANEAVYSRMRGAGGSTLSAIIIDFRGIAAGVNVGDSRIFAIRGPGRIEQLSRDDTLREHLAKNGSVRPDALSSNQLIQFIGIGEGLEPHFIQVHPELLEAVVLTSDGAHGLPMSVMVSLVQSSQGEFSELPRKLVEMSDLLGGRDNATAVLVPVGNKALRNFPAAEVGAVFSAASLTNSLEIWLPTYAGLHEFSEGGREYRGIDRRVSPEETKPKKAKPRDASKGAKSTKGKKRSSKQAQMSEEEAPLLNIKIK